MQAHGWRQLALGIAAGFALLLAQPLGAQNTNTGEIKGIVTDPTGAVIPAVAVTLTNLQTGVRTATTTNGSGLYDVPSLLPGNYNINFKATGFKDYQQQGVVLEVETIGINATLQVGSASQEVTVTAQNPLIETESSDQHVIFSTKVVEDVPTVGGVWYNELTNVLPGVNPGGGGSQDASGQGVGINGTQGYLGNWLIEGSDATQPRDVNASDNYPPVDSIAEVQAMTGNFGAQYGTGVAAFNVILKSGANQWHGSAFEFIQNDAFNAVNYFTPKGESTPLRWNEYGGSVGGPILRDKLFFYFTYQRNPAHSSFVETTTVPTDAMKAGDFSAFANPIYDPSTTTCGSYNGTPWCYRSQFSGNKITTAMDPVALAIQKYFPEPTDKTALYNNYRVVVTEPSLSQYYAGKVDYNISANHRLSGSILEYPISLINSIDALCPLGFDCTNAPQNLNQDAQVTETWTISSRTLNEARIGGVRELDKYVPPTYNQGYPAKLGIQPAYGSNAPGDIFPDLTVNGGDGAGQIGIGGGVHAVLADGAYVAADIVTLVRGRHTIKMGGEFDKSYQNYTNWGDVSSGNFQFNGIGTAEFWPNSNYPDTTGGYGTVASGSPYADFLLGQVYGWYVYDYEETGARMWNLAGFGQDDYKILPNLTLNLGLRYQFQSGWGEEHNRFGSFDPTLVNTGQYVPAGTLGAMIYGGQNGRNTIESGVNEWDPRLGLAWSPRPAWSLRASYGVFDAPRSAESYTDGALGLGLNPQGSNGYSSNFTTGVSYYPTPWTLQSGPPAGSVIYPNQSSFSNAKYNYQGVYYYPFNMPIEYYQEAMLSIEHQLPGNMLVEASYVYTKGTHLNFNRDINQVPAGKLSQGSAGEPYPQFTYIYGAIFDGYSNYNALQLRFEKRMSHGISFLVNYAWSKTMDAGTSNGHYETIDAWQNAYDPSANYGLSQLDVPQSLNGYATWELPFGQGRDFALHGVADEVLGGWRLTGVFQAHSGVPFTPTVGSADQSNSQAGQCYCGYAWFPNVVGNPKLSHPTINEWFNTAAFAVPAANTFGDARRDMLRGPQWRDVDFSLGKTFWLGEFAGDNFHMEVRADAFDALNNANFSQPSAGVGVAGGGVITSANTSRQVQLGARLSF
ncbi:MAG TPA: TonB-dependent receptor [Acidobacteriaceae bacterium]|jgi:outer membrane receptor protein involved in Fe transport|nr:TonB-dependent receptor [Acidobacteriaceae bacterium]